MGYGELTGGNMNIKALILCNGTMTMDCDAEQDEFWLDVSKSIGWIKFERMGSTRETFLATELRPVSDSAPCSPVGETHVLWSRKEAALAEIRISSYLQGLE